MSGIWLNIGCGAKHLSGFVNMDIERPYDKKLDARKDLPFADQTVDGVYSEHFFEHLTQSEGVRFLRECRRVLKPAGRIRIAMPDLDELVRRYQSEDWRGDGDMFKMGYDWIANRCEMLNIGMRDWGHKHLYNEEELVRIARIAGLEPLKRCEHGKSDEPAFAGRETRNGSRLIMEFVVPDRTVGAAPLVSVLIPAYRMDWFKEALQSALAQTYGNIEIIICDDSSNDEIEKMAREIAGDDKRVNYYRNERNEPVDGGLKNCLQCFALAKGEFIKYLNDDDTLAPACIEKMLSAFRQHPSVTLVTSYRKCIDEAGRVLPEIPSTQRLCEKDMELEGRSCANAIIRSGINFIGEPTTAMYRRSDLEWVRPHFFSFGGATAVGAGDVAMWLNLLGRGNAFYISEPLSAFRIHPRQRQNEPKVRKAMPSTWNSFVFHARRLGLMSILFQYGMKGRIDNASPWVRVTVKSPKSIKARIKQLAYNVLVLTRMIEPR